MTKFNNSKIFKKYICPNPFMYVELQENGNINTCCYINHKFGNINKENIKDIWNNNDFKELRRSILNGDFSYCDSSRCASMQKVLEKKLSNKSYQIPYELILKDEITDISSFKLEQNLPKIISFDDDQTCNLSCPSCRKTLIIETKEQSENKLTKEFQIIDECKNYLEEIWLCGAGDLFASRTYKKLLTTYDFLQIPNIKIRIDTNGVLFNEKAWNTTLKKVQNIINVIAISIDATNEKTYSLIRRGGNFNTLMDNLYFISSLKNKKEFIFIIRMIVQNDNFNQMADFIKLGKKLNVDQVVFSELQNWGTFSHEEYIEKAVHLEKNKNFLKLKKILQDPIFLDPVVNLGNLTSLFNKVNSEEK
ncbi:SPASM domain-containing protein [Halarcobacter sp.]|uniref:SPASM domain-containing protein n=1 Tax=Halarcobacter sp. TaxID=2321133 RepID=UPI0029F52AB3|nr:SPASM domain-containing protein [Halarcobacter sp.]